MWRLIKRFQLILKTPIIGRDRLATILRESGLKVRWPKRRQVKTTYSGHRYAVQPNLAKEFEVTAPSQLWVADITHISVGNSSAYLFLITDRYSRKIVGYHLATTLHASGAIRALNKALDAHGYPIGVIHHSDRGVQYCCHDFIDEVLHWELRSSMTDADHCAQNALAECMNGILKREFLVGLGFASFKEAENAIEEAIWTYNNLRIHGSHNLTPVEAHGEYPSALRAWLTEIISFFAPMPKRPVFV